MSWDFFRLKILVVKRSRGYNVINRISRINTYMSFVYRVHKFS